MAAFLISRLALGLVTLRTLATLEEILHNIPCASKSNNSTLVQTNLRACTIAFPPRQHEVQIKYDAPTRFARLFFSVEVIQLYGLGTGTTRSDSLCHGS